MYYSVPATMFQSARVSEEGSQTALATAVVVNIYHQGHV